MDDRTYQVFARKWRPRRFDDVVGQTAVVRTLKNALDQGRLAHAYCFSGIRGVGKTTLARLLAMGLNCRASESTTSSPCGICESCAEIESSRSLDVVELDAASRTGVDDVRELNEVARYAPSRDRYRVFIIDEAHMLSTAANNALLKTLEEPPARVVFILATTEPSKILPTVLSRCQHYQFGRINHGELGGHLGRIAAAEHVDISEDALALLATAADGSLRDGQSLLDKLVAFAGESIDERTVIDLLGLVDRILLFRATDLIAGGDLPGALGFVNEMVENGVDLHQFAVDLMGHFRDLLIVRSVEDPGAILHLPDDDVQRLRKQAEGFEIEDLDRAFSLLAASEYRIKMAERPRYHLEIVLTRLARLPRLEPIEDLLAQLRGDGGGSGGPAPDRRGGRNVPATRPAPTNKPPRSSRPTPRPVPAGATDASPVRPATGAVAMAGAATFPAPNQQPQAAPQPEPARHPEPAAAEPAAEQEPAPLPEPPPAPALLQRIQEQMAASHPLVAQVLGRCCGISMAGETVAFQFPESAAIFAERVRDPEVLRNLSAAGERVLGRRVLARVDTVPGGSPEVGLRLLSSPDESAAQVPAGDAARTTAPATLPSAPTGGSESTDAAAAAAATAAGSRDPAADLRRRAEQEPLVQEMLRALKGQLVSVEEL